VATNLDVVARLKVLPADGKAMADLASKAKETQKALEGGSKAVKSLGEQARAEADKIVKRRQLSKATEAELETRGLTKSGDPIPSGVGKSSATVVGGAIAGIYLLGETARKASAAMRAFDDPSLNPQARSRALVEQIPLIGGSLAALSDAIKQNTPEGRARFKGAVYGAEVERQTAFEAARYPFEMTGRRQEEAGMSPRQLEQLSRSRLGTANQDVMRDRRRYELSPNLESLAGYQRALERQKITLDEVASAQTKLIEQERGRIEGQKQFATLPIYERQRALQTANLLDKGGLQSLSKEQFGLLQGIDLFKPLVEREQLKTLQQDRGGFVKQATQISVQADFDAAEIAREIHKNLDPFIAELKITLGEQADNVQQQIITRDLKQKELRAQGLQ
jgi:hypothetical protein